jgi:hypothetical protein
MIQKTLLVCSPLDREDPLFQIEIVAKLELKENQITFKNPDFDLI